MKRSISALEPENRRTVAFFRVAASVQKSLNSDSIDLEEGEVIKYQCPNVKASLVDHVFGQSGTLYVTTERVAWLNENGEGFSLSYPRVSMHAISRDSSGGAEPYIYCQIDTTCTDSCQKENVPFHGRTEVEEAIEEDGNQVVTYESEELGFYPADKNHIDNIYNALCECAELHPDMEEDEEGGPIGGLGSMLELLGDVNQCEGFISAPEQTAEMSAEQIEKLDRFASMLDPNAEKQFEDAQDE